MTDLPSVTDITSGSTTEATFQSAMGNLHAYLSQLVTGASPQDNSIASGVITPSSTFIVVDTENSTSTDDLNRLVPTTIGPKIIFLKSKSSARSVVIKHMSTGTGQFYLNGGVDVTLDNTTKVIVFAYNTASSRWEELWRNWGLYLANSADLANLKTNLDLGTASEVDTGTGVGQVPLNNHLGALAYLATINNANLIADAIITGNKLANSTIGIGKLENGTAGGLLGFNASGVPAVIPPVASGRYLKDNGPGAAPTFETINLSQALTYLGGASLAGVAGGSVTWGASTYYRKIIVSLQDLVTSNGYGTYLRVYRNGTAYSGASYHMPSYANIQYSGSTRAEWWLENMSHSGYARAIYLEIDFASAVTSYGKLQGRSVSNSDYTSAPQEFRGTFLLSPQITGILVGSSNGGGAANYGSNARMDVWGIS